MNSLRAVIFDLDGVIIDSEPLHEDAFRELFAEIGYAESHGVVFSEYYGRSDQTLLEDFIARHRPPQPMSELLRRKQEVFLQRLRLEQPVFLSLPGLVERLAQRYTLAVASGSPHVVIDCALELKGLRRFFRATVSAEDVARGKPAPDIFLRAAELIGVEPSECCVIEDAVAGVLGATAAGMKVVAITNSLTADKLAGATWIVDNYEAVEEILLGPAGGVKVAQTFQSAGWADFPVRPGSMVTARNLVPENFLSMNRVADEVTRTAAAPTECCHFHETGGRLESRPTSRLESLLYDVALSSAISAAKARTSASVVSQEHIKRLPPSPMNE